MVLRKDSDRKTFTSTLRKDLYEQLQSESDKTGVPISKMLDKAVEKLFTKTFAIEDEDLHLFLVLLFGTKNKSADKEVENILREYVQEKVNAIDADNLKGIMHFVKDIDKY